MLSMGFREDIETILKDVPETRQTVLFSATMPPAILEITETYLTEPHAAPWRGRDEIVRRWLDRKDEPGDADFRWHPLTVTPEIAVIELRAP